MKKTPRPDMRDYFRARIDYHVNGMMVRTQARLPRGVRKISGDVDDTSITVTMDDGTTYQWAAGQFSTRKVNGCYAPLMPKPIN